MAFVRAQSNEFNALIHRVRARVHQWSSQLLSRGEKEVLIKTFAQAIPIYTMSYFLLPKNIMHELDRIVVGYWWGDKGSKQKIHWKRW